MSTSSPIRLVVFDWAGTTVDHGCFAPVVPFLKSLARFGVELSSHEARGPMGLHKRDHIRSLLSLEKSRDAFRQANNRDWTDDDVDVIFQEHFVPLQMEAVSEHCDLIDGVLSCVEALRAKGIKIGTTTGYFRQAAEVAYDAAASQGYEPDCNVCAEDVLQARPAPWMIFRIMEALEVYPPAAVVKIGDTIPDVQEGRNAGAWSIGVTHTSSEVGCTAAELSELPAAERARRISSAGEKLLAAGAHRVIDSVAQLPGLLPEIESWAKSQ